MAGGLEELHTAFAGANPRLAVFDRELRQQHRLWRQAAAIDVGPIIDRFAATPSFTDTDGRIVIPIHSPSTPEPTGQYLVCAPNHVLPCVVFFDYSTQRPARIDLDEFPTTYPATRIRFWHPDITPPAHAEPPVTDSSSTRSQASAATSNRAVAAEPSTTLFETARSFLERERTAEREAARSRFDQLSPTEFCRRHGGVASAMVTARTVDKASRQRTTFQPTTLPEGTATVPETYGLYPGTEVLVDTLDESEGFAVEGTVLDVDDDAKTLDVVIDWTTSSDKGRAEPLTVPTSTAEFVLGELLNPVPYDRETDAIEAVESHDRKAAVLTGTQDPTVRSSLDGMPSVSGLNEYQTQAARAALRAEDIYCIHGPPGTGKTRTLVAIIRAAVADGQKVLACAHSNQAVDNLLVGTSTEDRPDPRSVHGAADDDGFIVARVGANSSNPVVETHLSDVPAWKANVVGTTTSGAHRFGTDQFDLAVVDEATQAAVPASLIPVDVAKRTVLAGDHRQLPPYTSGETASTEAMGISLFEHLVELYGDAHSQLLRRQYRMNSTIAEFVNEAFYDEALVHGDRNRDWCINDVPPFVGIDVDGHEEQTPSQSYANDLEAKVAVREVSSLLHSGASASNIGIITPYSGQIARINARLAELDPEVAAAVTVDTVDSFQGGEREAIILSLVRSNPDGSIGFLGFPGEGPRRFNVALTRAQKRCTVIANWETFRESDAPAAEWYRRLNGYLREHGELKSFTEDSSGILG